MAGKPIMKVGERFYRLTVLSLIPDRKNPKAVCVCDCGNVITTQRGGLRNGHTKSCGCHRKEQFAELVASAVANKMSDEERRQRKQESFKAWMDKNREIYREKNNAATRKYYRANKDKARENCRNRRARLLNAVGDVSPGIEKTIYARQNGKCACCGTKLAPGRTHLDHITPLFRGGKHEDSNLQILCDKCNLSKGHKDPIEFMQSRGYLL